MKRIIYCLAILGIIFTGCDPMEDIYKDIDSVEEPVVGSDVYTLTSEDYDDLDLSFGSFSSEDDAKTMLPPFLAEKYPFWGKGSSVLVNYRLYIGNAEGVSDYTSAEEYEVAEADYYNVSTEVGDAGFFNNKYKAEDYIPGILDTNIASPEDGKKVAVSYEYASIDYSDISGTVIYQEDFQSYVVPDLGTLQTFSITGAQEWKSYSSSSGYQAGLMSGFSGGNQENEDWLILPEIDLTGHSNAELKLSQVLNFLATGVIGTDIAVKVSLDYDGVDPTTATWTNLDFDQWPVGTNYDIVDSTVSLADYADETITIGFYYKSTLDYAPNWRLVNIVVEEGEAIKTDNINVFYEYNNSSWNPAGGEVYYLGSADYDSMGTGSGQPGQYNNFSSSVPADDYIPTFLSLTAPYAYAQEEAEIFVIYKYFSSTCSCTQTRGNLYTVVDGNWTAYQSTIDSSLQFGNDGSTWVPDNTIRYTFTGADVAFISNAFIDIYPGPADNYGFFGSFDRRPSSSNYWSDEMLLEAFNALLENGNFITAEEQKYVLTYVIYNGATTNETKSVIKTGGVWVYQ